MGIEGCGENALADGFIFLSSWVMDGRDVQPDRRPAFNKVRVNHRMYHPAVESQAWIVVNFEIWKVSGDEKVMLIPTKQ